jgi:hypothetical protein
VNIVDEYDHYTEAKKIAARLGHLGWEVEAAKINEAIETGFSGTKIFMELRFLLTPFLYIQTLPADLKIEIGKLHDELDMALQ